MSEKLEKPIVIAVLERGWCVVGCWNPGMDGGYNQLTGAHVIRYWGTTKGLGELAGGGPTDKTKLDAIGRVSVPDNSIIMLINCSYNHWAAICRV